MSRNKFGPSLYYASDKNVFEALTQHKVDVKTVYGLFESRNIIVSKRTSRDDLATYFARLNHGYADHQEIAAKLGVVPQRERVTSMDVVGEITIEVIQEAVESVKREMAKMGDILQVSRDGDNLRLSIQYSQIDYKLSEFSQVKVKDGEIEFVKSDKGYIVRNTQNEFINNARETILQSMEKSEDSSIEKVEVSLFEIKTPVLRSKFFNNLIQKTPDYSKVDVTDVYVYKAKPESESEDDEEDGVGFHGATEAHIEKVLLRGNDLTRSELLNDLLDEDDYYIVKAIWNMRETVSVGDVYSVEALFSDPKNCTGFSFLLKGVHPYENGRVRKKRRGPTPKEQSKISIVIENSSRRIVDELREEYFDNKV